MVMALLGILAVSVAPRFQSTGSVVEYTYQSRLISSLRTMQQRAMNDTRSGFCFFVNVFGGSNSSFGPPTLNYANSNRANTCATTIDSSEDAQYLVANIDEMAADNVTITDGAGTISFNSMGCPATASGNCGSSKRIELRGETTIAVCIESQGYIHACD
ncbi:hypothetical protein GCM10009114_18910 [Aliiglaciecola litoralis]|uniref:MSHA pilin protein MshC n=2 Tax=Aliiglaciecola litoralis TaxID=582857 RepID=A0ABN1LIM2_9ALTE